MTDADNIIEHLIAAQKRIRENNPISDLPKDCVCVIHPRHRRTIEKMKVTPTGYPNSLPGLYGIPIYEENRAPQDKFEFMSLITYYQKYPPIFPKQYSRAYIVWDIVNTTIRRWYMRLKWRMKQRK